MGDDTEDDGGSKRCWMCGEVKPLEDYYRNKKTKDGRQGHCKPCSIASAKKYHDASRDQRNAYQREQRTRYPERAKANALRYREKNREHAAAKTREWREKNPEKLAAQRAQMPEYGREWRAKNPDKVLDWVNKRRALIANASCETRPVNRSEIAERDNWRCHICGKKVTKKTWSLDHLIPLSKGGPHVPENVALAHKRCNSRRGTGIIPAQLRLLG